MKRSTIYARVVLIAGILILVNLLSDMWYARLDFTADKQYTLSPATRDILNEMDDVVTVTAYFTRNLPPQLVKARRDFEDLLTEYESRSDGSVIYRFVNPNESEATEQEAQEKGIRPVMVNVTEKDQASQLRAYMGATLQMGEKTEVIPLIQPGAGVEYSLTTAIKKLSVEEKPKVGFILGHGESGVDALTQVMAQLSVLYDPENYTMTDTTEIPTFYRSMAMINPTDSIPPSHLAQLDRYLSSGGHLFIAYSNLQPDLSQGFLSSAPPIGLNEWMKEKGWSLGQEYIVDAASGSISVQQNMGGFVMNTQKRFPYFPIISRYADHPAMEGLETVILPFVSPISIGQMDSAIRVTPLAMTSENSGLSPAPVMVDINREWVLEDFDAGPQVVAVSAEGPLGGSGNGRMVVVSNGSFAVNGTGQQQQRVSEDNVNLVSNVMDWLSDDTGLINLRTKGITSRPIAEVDDGTRNLYKYGNVLAPILLILGLALVRRQRARKKRQERMEGKI